MAIDSGTKVGPYEILAPLGSGGMGEVYRARDTRLGRDVALKILPAEFSANRDRLDRFEQEARSASALNHPNIIKIYDVGSGDSNSYLSMELVEGKTLRDLLNEGSMSLQKVMTIATQLAAGLAKAHDAGIVHRDLKPENLMISKDGFLKILDFGLAKLTASGPQDVSHLQTQTGAGMIVGTVGYMSPEQAMGKAVDFRSDHFTFGMILYEMITAKPAFQRETSVEMMTAIIREDPQPLSSLNPKTPAVLCWIVERCLAKDPQERYACTRDLAHDLHSLRDRISNTSTSTAIVSETAQPQTKFSRFIIAIAIMSAFLVGAAVAYRLAQPKPKAHLKMTTLTYSGKDSSPAVSPDGKLIAFRSERDGKPRIWIKQVHAGNEIVLTAGPDDYPRFSPDGSAIFFIRTNTASDSLYRIPIYGGEERKILDNVKTADFSPDGKKIAFFRTQSGGSTLLVMNPDGTGVETIMDFPGKLLQFPRWSPDANRIAATRSSGSNAPNVEAIVIVDLKAKKQEWIRTTWPTSVVWTSNDHILYGTAQDATAVGPGGGIRPSGMIVLQDITSKKIEPAFWFSSSGDVLDLLDQRTVILHSSSMRANLRQISLAKIPTRWLTQGNSIDRQPVYSPDGEHVLFASFRSENLDLMQITIKTGAVRQITEDQANDWDPAYTRDGKQILWSSNRSGHFEIWMANTDGSESHQITNDGFDAENPTTTIDKRWIFYNSYNPEKRGIWKIHPDGSGAVKIFSGLTELPEVSADGNYVAFIFYEHTLTDPYHYLKVADTSTGAIVFQVKIKQTGYALTGRCRWMPDGKSIAYIDMNEAGTLGVFLQDFVPGKETFNTRRAIAGFDPNRNSETFAISSNGASIILSEIENLSSLVRIENVPGLPSKAD
ncbi:serine/threonine-protein kinase [bacterium]|nr:serine/threonine-protein kinase [bacterium]